MVARYGGEEFVCVLPDTPLEGAEVKANMLQDAIRSLAIPHEKSGVDSGIVTVSIGVASVIPHHEHKLTNLTLMADQMLYAAKQAGRGQVKSILL